MSLALDAGLAPVIAQVAELRNEIATASDRANGLEEKHGAERAQLRSELDGLRDALLGMTDALAERSAEMSARNDAAASTLRDEFNGRIGGLRDELAARIENAQGRLDSLAGDVVRMRDELRAEVASLAALFETTRAELKRRNGRSWAGRRARMYERIRRGWHAVVTGSLSRCGAPRPAADRPSRPMQAQHQ
jgi:chromosome segregation ATPase